MKLVNFVRVHVSRGARTPGPGLVSDATAYYPRDPVPARYYSSHPVSVSLPEIRRLYGSLHSLNGLS